MVTKFPEHLIGSSAILDLTTEPIMPLHQRIHLVQSLVGKISDDGAVWVICRNDYRDNELVSWPLMTAQAIHSSSELKLKNIMIVYRNTKLDGKPLCNAHSCILFFVKTMNYLFNKDSIREPHIFKDIEWGRRKTGTSGYHKDRRLERYPERGRDPGNVFFKDKRDDEGYVLEVIQYTDYELFEKLVKLTTNPGWTIITNTDNSGLERVAIALGRKMEIVKE